MRETDNRTLSFYDDNAVAYAERNPHDQDMEALDLFISELPGGASVCDLGCGNGWASARLMQAGFLVTALDGSLGLAAEAKRLYNLDVEVATFDDFSYQVAFDAIWACWSLHHAPRDTFPALLNRVAKAVRPGGLLFLSMKGGSGEGRDSFDRFYAYYTMDELIELVNGIVDGQIVHQYSWAEKCFEGTDTQLHQLLIKKTN